MGMSFSEAAINYLRLIQASDSLTSSKFSEDLGEELF
jgi:hypothetical protein